MDRLLYNVGVVSKSDRLRGLLRRMSMRLNLNKVPLYLNLRDMERIYLRKA